MKRKLLTRMALLLCAFVGVSSVAWAEVVYTLKPASGSNNSYAGNCDIEIAGITWNLTGNSQQIPWRIGGKSLSNVDRGLYSKTAISDDISKIEVTHGDASGITVNSWTVIVSKNADFSNLVSTLTPTFAANSSTTITRPSGEDWSNCYFKFVYNVSVSGSSNKFIEFSEAKFYKETISYNITAQSNNNDYGTATLSGNLITAEPANGYRVIAGDGGYTVTSGTATVTNNGNNTFTVNASSDCAITINFEAIPTHTVTFSVNGTVTTASVKEGANIEFPADPQDIYGKAFKGWTDTPITGTQPTPPTFFTDATMGQSDVTYYAVFATEAEEVVEQINTYGFEDANTQWTISDAIAKTSGQGNTGSYAGEINTNHTYVTFNTKVKVTEFSFAFKRKTNNENYKVYIETSTNNSTWVAVETYEMSEFGNGTYTTKTHAFDGNTELYVRFHCYNTTAVRYVDDVTIKYFVNTTVSNDYCTTVPTTATISINSACTDGNSFFGTYYTNVAYVMPAGMVGQTVTVTNDVMTVTDAYAAGDVVPANTALLLKAETAGEKVVNLATGGTAPTSNMLKGTLTADATTVGENCLFYRLTMHNNTQIGFWWGAENGGRFTPGANKAYLAVPVSTTPGQVRMGFTFGGDATGIEAVSSKTAGNNQYFDLQGRRVLAPAKGLYIVNGKKVNIK